MIITVILKLFSRTKIIIAILLYILPLIGFAEVYNKGEPFINNYFPIEYRADGQNWSVSEDKRGIMYFANSDGVLEFDGNFWNLITLPGGKPATSIASDNNGIVYVGSNSEFGYLKSGERGELKFKSLLNLFPENKKEFSFVWDIITTDDKGVFFKSEESVYHLKDSTVRCWENKDNSILFKINGRVYLYNNNPGMGLFYFDDQDFILFRKENSLAEYNINGVYPYSDDKILISSTEQGFFLVNNIIDNPDKNYFNPKPLENQEVFDILKTQELTSGIKLSDGNYAFGTMLEGVFIMDKNGALIRNINNNSGIQSQSVNHLYESKNQILWIALENGLSSTNLNYPLTFWDITAGYEGVISDITRFKGDIYIATWQGVYKMKDESSADDMQFTQINGIQGRAWEFIILTDDEGRDDKLLVATNDGIYDVYSKSSRLIAEGMFFTLKQSKHNDRIILVGGDQGLSIMHYDRINRSFNLLFTIDELEIFEIFEIVELEKGFFWLSHRSEGISAIKLKDFESYTKPTDVLPYEVFYFGADQGIPKHQSLRPLRINDSFLFYSPESLYFFKKGKSNNFQQGTFVPFCILVNKYLKNNIDLLKVKSDKNSNFWIQFLSKTSRLRTFFFVENLNNNYNFDNYKIIPVYYASINKVMVENDASTIWFAANDVLYRLEKKALYYEPDSVKTFIRGIRVNNRYKYSGAGININNDPFITEKKELRQSLKGIPVKSFSHSESTFSFEYANPSYFYPSKNLYSVYLENHDSGWSDWSYNTEKTYSNLPPGEYTFMVKSRDALGNQSKKAKFAFKILNPWYKTQVAYIAYIMMIILLIYFAILITNRRLVKAKAKLEGIVKNRTCEILNQQKNLEIEKEKSEKLLKNILPAKIAQELKAHGNVQPKFYEMATVMFMDFKDFSKISQYADPLQVINEIDKNFIFFDKVCAKHNLEKIKIMGDAYMCAGGIPQPNKTNPFDAVLAAFEILEYIKKIEKDQWLCKLRVGIHTGELIAGVIGENKFAYDIWGRTVNTASRLEAAGEANKINISRETYNVVKDFFEFTYRGRLPAKHSGEYEMYFVNRIKKEYSEDPAGKKPNKEFIEIINNIK